MAARRRRLMTQVPASASNLGSGFDALGMALHIHSRYEVTLLEPGEPTRIEAAGLNAENIPIDESNLAYQAYLELHRRVGRDAAPIQMRILNGIPLERGLGGSGSAILGGLLSANAALDEPLSDDELLSIAAEMDGHPDNVAASLFGGLRVVCWDGREVLSLPVKSSDDLQVVVAIPRIRVETKAARAALPREVPFEDAVFNVGRVALLVAAFASLEYSYLDAGMQDRLHQRYRQLFIPQMDAVFDAAKQAGAWAVALSGSGPSIAAYCTGQAEAVGEAMRAAFAEGQVEAAILMTTIDFRGASVVAHADGGDPSRDGS